MTSDVFGERRLESLDGLGYDLTRGSFEDARQSDITHHVRAKSTPEH